MLFATDLAAAIVTLAAALVAAAAILLGGGERPHHATGALHGMAGTGPEAVPASLRPRANIGQGAV